MLKKLYFPIVMAIAGMKKFWKISICKLYKLKKIGLGVPQKNRTALLDFRF